MAKVKHIDQGGCENFDGEAHTVAQCKRMARQTMEADRAALEDAANITPGGSLIAFNEVGS